MAQQTIARAYNDAVNGVGTKKHMHLTANELPDDAAALYDLLRHVISRVLSNNVAP